MTDNISPEEKLLRLIRGEKKAPADNPGPAVAPKPIKSEKENLPAAQLKLPAHKFKPFSGRKFFFVQDIQKVLLFVLLGSLVFLAVSFAYPWLALRKSRVTAVPLAKNKTPAIPLVKKESRPLDYYMEGLRNHQIFGDASGQGGATAPSIAAEAQTIKDINLLGVILGDNPQAIVEDKKTQKTYYVTKGQFIGDFQVEEIRQGKVILNNKGERFELNI